jgi:hypothetical protein
VHATEELQKLMQHRPRPQPQPQPKPEQRKPGDAPRPDAPKPGQPRPLPIPEIPPAPTSGQQEAKIPAEIQKMIQPRGPFVNYYFNELNRDRVWGAAKAKGDFGSVAGAWKLGGQTPDGGKVEVTLGSESSSGTFPAGPAKVEEGKDLDQQLGPPASGGLLAALHLWRQLLILGPQKFGDVYYYGTAPYTHVTDLADVLVATRNVAEANLAFDPQSGLLAVLEMTVDADTDSCELRLSDYRDVGGRQFPHTIEVRVGDRLWGVIQWSQVELAIAEAKP